MDWIDYRQLPLTAGGFSELFFDYVNDFKEVRQFYRHNFRDIGSFDSVMKSIDATAIDRRTLVLALDDQNRNFGSPPKTFENISLLGESSTYAVVTGQQVGLLGGPLYTLLKTITTIKLAEQLRAKFPRHNFVPVFWIEGEDHDFAEMNNTSFLDADNKPIKIEYLPGGEMPERNLGPIGELTFDAALAQTYSQIESALQKTEFTDGLLRKLQACYAQGKTFNRAFVAWMNILFEDDGLVFISSNDPRLKRLLSPLFTKEISEYPKISQMVITQSAELEKNYHAQVKAKSINLFLFHKGGRYLIEPRENDFSLKGTRHFLQKDELLKIAQETPELLSTNVILRPLAQDTLLPTVVYVGGPSEIAYHAQLGPIYDYTGVVQPVIYPRASCTLIEERLRKTKEKYSLDLMMFFGDINKLTSHVLEQIADVRLDAIFSNTSKLVNEALNELRFGLKEIDPTLLGTLDGVASKIDSHLASLKEKSVAAQKRKNEIAVRQLEKAARSVLPDGNLQEREVNVVHYMNRHGFDIVKWIASQIDINGFKHQLLPLR